MAGAVGALIITIVTAAGWMQVQSPDVIFSGSLKNRACLEGWGCAISGLQVLSANPFAVTRAPKAKLKQILVKKMEGIKAHIPWEEGRIVALLIRSPPARSSRKHDPSLAAPPVTKIMKLTKRERKAGGGPGSDCCLL